jgi:hypothetical protein
MTWLSVSAPINPRGPAHATPAKHGSLTEPRPTLPPRTAWETTQPAVTRPYVDMRTGSRRQAGDSAVILAEAGRALRADGSSVRSVYPRPGG